MHSGTNLYSKSIGCYTNVLHSLNLAGAQSENFVWRKDADGSRRQARKITESAHVRSCALSQT